MKQLLHILLAGAAIIACRVASADQFKVAVIDDGLSLEAQKALDKLLCKTGHHNFVTDAEEIGESDSGHGDLTTIGLAINAQSKNYCILFYKIGSGMQIGDAMARAVKENARVMSLSVFSSTYFENINTAVKRANEKGIKMFVAAGNDKQNLNDVCNIFPQCLKYPNIINVGAVNLENELETYSNYGTIVKMYKLGRAINGHRGTSFAAPAAAGEYIRSLNLDKK